MKNLKILVTGAGGFIGYHVSKKLLDSNYEVIGYDNINSYYDISLKNDRIKNLKQFDKFVFEKDDLENKEKLFSIIKNNNINVIINLAAQAGVRYSLENPYSYIDSNITGFLNILEASKQYNIEHLIFASSSSVYGANETVPFSVHQNVDHPLSLYAATKKANELMAHTYSNLYHIPVTGLRFFTVYGPWGRPDMALFLFTKAIIEGKPIKVYNYGKMERDFTYIDDIVEGIVRIINNGPAKINPKWSGVKPDPASSFSPYRIYNIGNNNPVSLEKFISVLEEKIGKKAVKEYLPLQPGDVSKTCADINDLMRDTGFRPSTSIEEGVDNFIKWYKEYYNV